MEIRAVSFLADKQLRIQLTLDIDRCGLLHGLDKSDPLPPDLACEIYDTVSKESDFGSISTYLEPRRGGAAHSHAVADREWQQLAPLL